MDLMERIARLEIEAVEASDLEQVDLCQRALRGDDSALAECERVLRNAEAQEQ